MQQRLFHYEGKVQGVGFRATTLKLARGYDLCGYVKNLPSGEVELFLYGEEEELTLFLEALRQSELRGHIEEERELPPTPIDLKRIKGFVIL